ncbi:TOBE domain-containing protein [Acidithiobacillus thiooxidans]|jgi:molybdopterin-binding protein|uniref:Transporter n=2 Tax=Acidithiobacillus thiooxidans TaxID=930 RepID=A0A1C2IRI7_ACITH|nr:MULTISPECIES: TOBE domain-containing protein [Acidithiobacillus]MBE7561530.1 TOBE domain-containing protein [Acidithiobacillus sp. HP-6]MBE7570299.1 TOBE domain-containing protein [Acidithiobacillus sp. HP-2]MBU2841050.1 TOBE domain-containing protein [Acidithiobacillus thiooxidans]MDX5934074.1 TOBE domain-containing protein [Acidithiobacillus thiooxidans]OCX76501.1 transporter [Acidithiobacillus thiooxidans]
MESSLRNHLKGKVVEIIKDSVVSEVVVETSAGMITSVITTRSVERLKLKEGDEVFAAIKASEVSIEKP